MKGSTLPINERNVILVFGEMSMNPIPCYDSIDDQVYGPCSQLLLVMIQGLHSDWSQPIFFDFDKEIDKILIHKIVNDIECTGLQVRGIVSEVTEKTCALWNSLDIKSDGNTYFTASAGTDR